MSQTNTFRTFRRSQAHVAASFTLLVAACSPTDQLRNENAEKIFRKCMEEYDVEVEKVVLTENEADIRIGEHNLSSEELQEALSTCEEKAVAGLDGTAPNIYEGLSASSYEVEMRDGVRLATDVYLPEGKGPFPAVLFRTPYDKNEDGPPFVKEYLEAGIAVVAQDLRGRFASEGVDRVFTTEGDGALKDGYDTLSWLVEQPFSNGRVMSEGYSASAITAYMQLSAQPPGLRGAVAYTGTPNLYDAILEGGVLRESLVNGWLDEQNSLHFLEEIEEHPFDDDFWRSSQLKYAYDRAEIPVVHITGWFDVFVQGGIDAFVGFQNEGAPGAKGSQKLVIGPWSHADDDVTQGGLEFPQNARDVPVPINSIHAALASHVLELSEPLTLDSEEVDWKDIPAVQYYVMGASGEKDAPGNEWRTADRWPPAAWPTRFFLEADGVLSTDCPSGGTSAYTFDPREPARTECGNNLLLNTGPCDQRNIEQREDTLTFTTPTLDETLEITGRPSAHLFVELDQVDADIMVKLADVYPNGASHLITEGAARIAARDRETHSPVEPGERVELSIDLHSTSIILNEGHRLRVAVSSSNAPRYRVNHNNGAPLGSDPGKPLEVEVRLHHGNKGASYIELPRPDIDAAEVVVCGEE